MKKYKNFTTLTLIFMTVFQYSMEDKSEQREQDLQKIKKIFKEEELRQKSVHYSNIVHNSFISELFFKGYCLSVAEQSDSNQIFPITYDDYIPGQLHISENIEKQYSAFQKKYLPKSYFQDDLDY